MKTFRKNFVQLTSGILAVVALSNCQAEEFLPNEQRAETIDLAAKQNSYTEPKTVTVEVQLEPQESLNETATTKEVTTTLPNATMDQGYVPTTNGFQLPLDVTLNPEAGFLAEQHELPPWQAYQSYDQLPTRFQDKGPLLYSFDIDPETADLFDDDENYYYHDDDN